MAGSTVGSQDQCHHNVVSLRTSRHLRQSFHSADSIACDRTIYDFPYLLVSCPLLTIIDPLIHHRLIPHLQTNFERLRIHSQTIRHLVATEAVQNRTILGLFGRQNLKGNNTPQESSVQLAVRQMCTDAPVHNLVSKQSPSIHKQKNPLTSDSPRPAHNAAFPS